MKTLRAPDDRITAKIIEPIIPIEQFNLVQQRIAETRYNHHESRKRDEVFNYGAGVARCGWCAEKSFTLPGSVAVANEATSSANVSSRICDRVRDHELESAPAGRQAGFKPRSILTSGSAPSRKGIMTFQGNGTDEIRFKPVRIPFATNASQPLSNQLVMNLVMARGHAMDS